MRAPALVVFVLALAACSEAPKHPPNLESSIPTNVGTGSPPPDGGTDGGGAASAFAVVPNARGLTLFGGYLYISSIGSGGATGLIVRAPIGSGTPETLVENVAEPWAIVASDTRVAFTTASSGTGAGAVYGLLLGGTTVDTLSPSVSGAYGLSMDATSVYYTEATGTLGVERRLLATSSTDRIVTSNVLATGNALRISGPDVFVAASNGIVYRAPVLGGVLEALDVPLAGAIVDLAVDTTTVYGALDLPAPAGAIVAWPKLGGAGKFLATGLDRPARLALDNGRVYYTQPTRGAVEWVAIAGGTPSTVASGLDTPIALAVGDAAYVGTATAVVRVPK